MHVQRDAAGLALRTVTRWPRERPVVLRLLTGCGVGCAATHYHLGAVPAMALAVHAAGRHVEDVAGAVGLRDAACIDSQLAGDHEDTHVGVVRMGLRRHAMSASPYSATRG